MGAPDPARDCSHRRCRRTRADRRSKPRDRCGSRVRSSRTTRPSLAVTSAMTLRCSRRKRRLALCGADLVFSCPPRPSMRWGVGCVERLRGCRAQSRSSMCRAGRRADHRRTSRPRRTRSPRRSCLHHGSVARFFRGKSSRSRRSVCHELVSSKRRGGERVRRSGSRRRRSRLAIVSGRAREGDRARRHDMSIDRAESS
jgi:hypothetical protein